MKIVQTSKAYSPKVGGIETNITTLSEGFVKKYQAEVEVLVCNHERTFNHIDKIINEVKVKYLRTFGFLYSLPISPDYASTLLKYDGDILHIHEPFPLADLSLEFFPKLRKRFSKIVTTWHCDITRQKWALPLYGRYIHKFLESVDKITVSNPDLIESSEFLPAYKEKCVVIPHGIDLNWVNISTNKENIVKREIQSFNSPLILFVGRLVVYKGIEFLIEAMNYVENGLLLIIGSGPLEKSLKNQIQNLNLSNRVKLISEVDEENLHGYYKACDIFVLPSINKTETYGIVQIEAMACGKPVICTELNTGTTFVNQNKKTGLVVPPCNSKALAEAINKLLKNKNLLESIGLKAKERAFSEFNSEKMIKRTYELYEKLLANE